MRTAQQTYDLFRAYPDNDMYEYSPYLRQIARGNILEIGVGQGVSTAAFLCGLDDKNDGHLYSIDVDASCAKLFDHPRWTFINADSTKYIDTFPSLDVLMIDGDHHYDAVLSDLKTYSPLVKPGGLILLHDVSPHRKDYDAVTMRWMDGRPEAHQFPPLDPFEAMQIFLTQHLAWKHKLIPGHYGLGVIHVE